MDVKLTTTATGANQRTPWIYAEMKPFDNGNGYNDGSGERGSYPISDSSFREDVELTNLHWLQIAAVNAPGGTGTVRAFTNADFLSPEAVAHNKAYAAGSGRDRRELGGTIAALVVYGITPEQLHDTLIHFDPQNNNSDL